MEHLDHIISGDESCREALSPAWSVQSQVRHLSLLQLMVQGDCGAGDGGPDTGGKRKRRLASQKTFFL